jgi:hypothetical protein
MRSLLALLLIAAPAAAQQFVSVSYETGPPAAPFLGPGVEYAYDDGTGNNNLGPPASFNPDMLWGNAFARVPGGEIITEIAVAFGPTFPSAATNPVTLWLLDDPDGDFDPRTGATAIASAQVTPTVFGNTFVRVAIPPTPVSSHFFVGASVPLLGGQDRPARADWDAPGDRSWFFYAPDIAAVINSLADAPFGTRMDNPQVVPIPSAFMVRATGVSLPVSTDAPPERPRLVLDGAQPVRGTVHLTLSLGAPEGVRADAFDALGRRVARLTDGRLPAGRHALSFTPAAPGVYVVRLASGGQVESLRVVVVS